METIKKNTSEKEKCELCGLPKKRNRGRYCKPCGKIARRPANRAWAKAAYAKDPRGVMRRTMEWAKKNPEKVKAAQRRFHQTHKREQAWWQIEAHHAVNNSITAGKLIRQSCQIKGCGKPGHAHHDSYKKDRYLDVKWFCRAHHRAWHRIFVPELPTDV